MLEQLIECAHEAYRRGLVSGTGGNVSLCDGEFVYITATGAPFRKISENSFVRVDRESGRVVELSGGAPSKELRLHLAIYQVRPDIKVILHLHPVECIAAVLMLQEDDLLPVYVPGHLKKLGRPPQVPYYPAGSEELARYVAYLYRYSDCVWLRNHGIVVGACDADTALAKAEDMADSCRLHLQLRGQGALPEELVQKILKKQEP